MLPSPRRAGGGKGDPSPSQLLRRSVPGGSWGDQSPPPNARTLLAGPLLHRVPARAPERGCHMTTEAREAGVGGRGTRRAAGGATGRRWQRFQPSHREFGTSAQVPSPVSAGALRPGGAARSVAVKGAAARFAHPQAPPCETQPSGSPRRPPALRAPRVPAAPLPGPRRMWRTGKLGLSEACPSHPSGTSGPPTGTFSQRRET